MSEPLIPASDSSLKTRLRSALMLAPLVLAVVYVGGLPFVFMMAAGAAMGVREWVDMVLPHNPSLKRLASGLAAVAALGAAMFGTPVTSLIFLIALCFVIFAVNYSQGGPSVKLLIGGIIYIGFAVAMMIWLRSGTSVQGLFYFSTLLAMVWASDVGAYFVGKTIGGPKLAPAISPKKTWSGFWGSSVAAASVAAVLASPWMLHILEVDSLGGLPSWIHAIIGFFMGMVGQAGDLLVSIFKRRYNIKDTGTLIPGHGGLLDRIDALMLVAMVYGLLVYVLS